MLVWDQFPKSGASHDIDAKDDIDIDIILCYDVDINAVGGVMETTGRAMVDHWRWASDKGLMNKNTALSLRAAAEQVLSIEPEWEMLDVSNIDVEELLTRFQNLRGKQFKPESLNSYKRRFRQAHKSFLEYVENPAAWKPTVQDRPSRPNVNSKRGTNGKANGTDSSGPPPPTGPGLVEYPYPLREGAIVRLILPTDLKLVEVKRLAAFMRTLAIDYELDENAQQLFEFLKQEQHVLSTGVEGARLMDGKVSRAVWKWIAFVWMCIEIGQFIEYHVSLNKNELFWPFWTCFTLVILLGAHLLDLHFDRQQAESKSSSPQEMKQASQKYKQPQKG